MSQQATKLAILLSVNQQGHAKHGHQFVVSRDLEAMIRQILGAEGIQQLVTEPAVALKIGDADYVIRQMDPASGLDGINVFNGPQFLDDVSLSRAYLMAAEEALRAAGFDTGLIKVTPVELPPAST